MLMTVLRGELAIQQSRALIRIFRAMKDYISETQGLVTQRDLLRLSMQTNENTEAIHNIHSMLEDQQRLLLEHDDKLVAAFESISALCSTESRYRTLIPRHSPYLHATQ